MNPIMGWVIGILAVVILGVVVDLLMGQTKMGKYVRSVFAAVTVLVIVLPLPSLFQNGCSIDGNFVIESPIDLDENFLQFTSRVKLNHLARGVELQLAQHNINGARVTLDGTATVQEISVQRATVNLQNAVIEPQDPHINVIEWISRLVAQYLHIEQARVVIINGNR